MTAGTKFQSFVTEMAAGTHAACLGADTDTLKVVLTNTGPDAAADAVLVDLPAQCTGTGYTAGGDDVTNAFTDSAGTITVDGTNIVWTAGAGGITAFRYTTLYNDTPSSPADPLIAYWDYGSSVILAEGETFTFNIVTNLFTIA